MKTCPMRNYILLLQSSFFLSLCSFQVAAQQQADTTVVWKLFEIQELQEQLSKSGKPWLPFLDVNTLSCGIYALSKGGEDKQSPHRQDEVYYILEGKASIKVGEEVGPAKAGSVIFVKAGIPHQFIDIEEDLKVLVFFSAASPK